MMLHRALRRPCVGCYKILSNNYYPVSKGRSYSQVLRPLVTKQKVQEHPNWLKTTRPLQGLSSRCTESTNAEIRDTSDDIEDVQAEKKGNLSNVFKVNSVQRYADRDSRTLYVQVKDRALTKSDLLKMSEDAIDIYFSLKSGGFAFLKFASEEMTVKNYALLQGRADIAVAYKGENRLKQLRERDAKVLKVEFANEAATEEDVYNLSEDIKKVVLFKGDVKNHAYLHFGSEEDAIKNFKKFKQTNEVSSVDFTGLKMSNSGLLKLCLNRLEPEVTEEELMKLSEDILDVHIHTVSSKHRMAFLTFGSEELAAKNYVLFRSKYEMNPEFTGEKYKNPDVRKLWMSVDREISEKDLMDLSEDILRVTIIQTEAGRQAFLEFSNEMKAVENCRMLREKFGPKVQPKSKKTAEFDDRKLCLGILTSDVTKEQLLQLSSYIVDAHLIDQADGRLAFVEFISESRADDMYRKWKKMMLPVRFCGIKHKGQSKRVLFLSQIHSNVSKADIFQLSSDILDVNLVEKDTSRYAFLEYGSQEVAERSYKQLKESLGSAIQLAGKTRDEFKDRSLFMSKLDDDATEQSLAELSTDILTAEILQDNTDSRNCILEFSSKQNAVETYKILKNAGKQVSFRWERGTDHKRRKLWAAIHDSTLTKNDILKISDDILHVNIADGPADGPENRKFAIIEFLSRAILDRNLEKFKEESVAERFTVKYMQGVEDDFKVWVGGITSREELENHLSEDHTYLRVGTPASGKMYALIGFDTKEAAERTLGHLKEEGFNAEWSISTKYRARCLRLSFDNLHVTEEDILMLSKDIWRVVNLVHRELSQKTEAIVEFRTDRITDENYKLLYDQGQQAGFTVYHLGEKGRAMTEALQARSLHMKFPNTNVTQEDIHELSTDIESVRLLKKYGESYAYVVFATHALAVKHCEEFKGMGLEVKLQLPEDGSKDAEEVAEKQTDERY